MSRQDPHEEFGTNERGFPNRYPDDPQKQDDYEVTFEWSKKVLEEYEFGDWPKWLQDRFMRMLDCQIQNKRRGADPA